MWLVCQRGQLRVTLKCKANGILWISIASYSGYDAASYMTYSTHMLLPNNYLSMQTSSLHKWYLALVNDFKCQLDNLCSLSNCIVTTNKFWSPDRKFSHYRHLFFLAGQRLWKPIMLISSLVLVCFFLSEKELTIPCLTIFTI